MDSKNLSDFVMLLLAVAVIVCVIVVFLILPAEKRHERCKAAGGVLVQSAEGYTCLKDVEVIEP